MLFILPKALLQTEESLIFCEGITEYSLPYDNRLSSLFYSEIMVNENNELVQLGQILNIDVSVFLKRPKYLWASEYNGLLIEYRLHENKDSEKGKDLKRKVDESKERYIQNYFSSNEGWASLDEIKNKSIELLEKVKANPYCHRELNYNIKYGKYFFIDETEVLDQYDDGRRFHQDIPEFLEKLDEIQNEGYEYITLFND